MATYFNSDKMTERVGRVCKKKLKRICKLRPENASSSSSRVLLHAHNKELGYATNVRTSFKNSSDLSKIPFTGKIVYLWLGSDQYPNLQIRRPYPLKIKLFPIQQREHEAVQNLIPLNSHACPMIGITII